MTYTLYFAAGLAIITGIAHSYLGERYILMRLFRSPELPKLFRNVEFITRTLRLAWHVTSLAWWGFAFLLIFMADGSLSNERVALVVAITFLLTALLTLIMSKAKHLAWIVFLAIGLLSLSAAF